MEDKGLRRRPGRRWRLRRMLMRCESPVPRPGERLEANTCESRGCEAQMGPTIYESRGALMKMEDKTQIVPLATLPPPSAPPAPRPYSCLPLQPLSPCCLLVHLYMFFRLFPYLQPQSISVFLLLFFFLVLLVFFRIV